MPNMKVDKDGISVGLPKTVSGICASGGVFTIILGVVYAPVPEAIGVGLALVLLGAGIYLLKGR